MVLAMLGAAACASHPQEEQRVDVMAAGGATLKASLFSAGARGPAMLLIHQCNMNRHAWDALAVDLSRAGIHVLTYDQRGFGDTGGREQPQTSGADADAALAFIEARPDVDRTRIAAGGASCGVAVAADLAARHPEIRALLLMSGGASQRGLSHIASSPELAVFGIAGEWDTQPVADIRQAVAASRNPRSVLKTYRGDEHGVPLFAKHADLMPAVRAWLMDAFAPSASR